MLGCGTGKGGKGSVVIAAPVKHAARCVERRNARHRRRREPASDEGDQPIPEVGVDATRRLQRQPRRASQRLARYQIEKLRLRRGKITAVERQGRSRERRCRIVAQRRQHPRRGLQPACSCQQHRLFTARSERAPARRHEPLDRRQREVDLAVMHRQRRE